MQVLKDISDFKQLEPGCVATIGKFDGVHLGHQLIVDQLRQKSEQLSLPTLVILIEPHPEEFFASDPSQAPARLTTVAEKLRLLEIAKVDYVYLLEFNLQLSQLSAEAYIEDILVAGLGVACFIVGNDFRFGHQRRGDYQLLQSKGALFGFEVLETATYEHNGERISSTYVREKLADAEFELLELFLGRPYSISGQVVKGQQLGKTIGFPTCNISLPHKKIPLHGVYACHVDIAGKVYMAAVNIGYRPTVMETSEPVLEVHILDFSGDLYGAQLEIVFRHQVRNEEKFDSLETLKRRISEDVARVRELLG